MLRRLVVLLVPGLVTSLIATWLLGAWGNFDITTRTIVSGIIGVLTVTFLIFVTRERDSKSPVTRVASGLESRGNARVERVDLTGAAGDIDIASGITSKEGDVTVRDIKVHRGTNTDATN